MGIIKAFRNASKVIEDSKRDVKQKPRDEVSDRRQQRKSGGKK